MGVGRVICVALPFALTIGSLIFLLIAALAGVSNQGLYLFRVNTTDLTINPASFKALLNNRDLTAGPAPEADAILARAAPVLDPRLFGKESSGGSSSGAKTNNITAADLGMGDLYDVSLWGYCVTGQDGARTCTKSRFDWASGELNTSVLTTVGAATGRNITLPKEVSTALDAFVTVSKWTQIVFCVALVCLDVNLFFGIFATCSRAWSCVTWIIAGLTTTFVMGAAAMSTATAVIVVGTVETTAKWYGVHSSFNGSFLALVWISAALALAAGLFWLFTVCCCAPNHSSRKNHKRGQDAEKLLPTGAYTPLHEPQHNGFYNNTAPQYGAPRYPAGARTDMAYEPYSHR